MLMMVKRKKTLTNRISVAWIGHCPMDPDRDEEGTDVVARI